MHTSFHFSFTRRFLSFHLSVVFSTEPCFTTSISESDKTSISLARILVQLSYITILNTILQLARRQLLCVAYSVIRFPVRSSHHISQSYNHHNPITIPPCPPPATRTSSHPIYALLRFSHPLYNTHCISSQHFPVSRISLILATITYL